MTTDYRRMFFLLMLVAAVVLTAGLGLRDPWPADEPRFALIARDMAEGGSWLLPSVGGVLYPDKPPLHFWVVAALYVVTGSLRISFLLPALLGGLIVLGLVTDLGRRLWGEKTGLWSGAILLSLLQFPLQMKSGQLDGPLCVWTTLSLYGLCRHLLLGPDWRWYAIGGLAAGCGVITKGVGVLPFLVFIPWALAARGKWELPQLEWRDWRWLLGPGLALVAVAAWLVPMLLATSGDDPARLAYRDNILFHQTVTRYANSWGHIKPPWYLWTHAVPWLWLPATALLPWLVPAWWRDLRARKNAPLAVLGGWILLVLLFFSLSSGKRSVYIFPAAPAFALIVAAYADALITRIGVRRMLIAFAVILGLLIGALGIYGVMNPHDIRQWTPNAVTGLRLSATLIALGACMVTLVLLTARRRPLVSVSVALGLMWAGLALIVAPAINDVRSGKAIMNEVAALLPPASALALVGWPEQFILHAPGEVVHFGFRRESEAELHDAITWLEADESRRILVSRQQIDACLPAHVPDPVGLAHRRNWLLLGSNDIGSHCHQDAESMPNLLLSYRPPDSN